jgi:competence protein ComEC
LNNLNHNGVAPKRSLCWHCLAFAAGIAFCGLTGLSFQIALFILLAGAAAAFFSFRRKNFYLLLIFTFAVGIFWMSVDDASQKSFPYEKGDEVAVSGMALENSVESLDEEGHYSFLLQADSIDVRPCDYTLYIYADDGQKIFYGEYLRVQGSVMQVQKYANANAFDYETYLKRNGIEGSVSAAFGGQVQKTGKRGGNLFLHFSSDISLRFEAALSYLPQDQQNLIKGVFLGEKAGLSDSDKRLLSQTGIMHAFSVSGLHVGYIILFGLMIFGTSRKNRWLRLAIISFLIIFYVSLTGLNPPIIRASLMGIVGLLAFSLDRKADTYTSLAISAAFCLLWRPLLIFDAGFQLSFVAVFGILYLAPLFYKVLPGSGFINRAFAVTFAACLATIPLVAYYFYLLSFAAMSVSPILVLLIGVVVILAFISCIFSIFSLVLAVLPLAAGGWIMEFVYNLATWIGSWPISYVPVARPAIWAIVLFYVVLLLLPPLLAKKGRWPVWLIILLLLLLLISPFGKQSDNSQYFADVAGRAGVMEVTFIDVGQGDSALVVTPRGHYILIDGGGKLNDGKWIGEKVLLPYLQSRGVKELDLVICSHPHDDHISGLLTAIENLGTEALMTADAFADVELQKQLEAEAGLAGAKIIYVAAGEKYLVEEDLYLTVFAPYKGQSYDDDSANKGSVVAKLSYYDIDFLFTGDLEGDNLDALSEQPVDAEVLKLPHHGSRSSFDTDFYKKVAPKVVVISVGENNSYGHPASVVTDYFKQKSIPIYRTDLHGGISFFSDGYALEVQTVE